MAGVAPGADYVGAAKCGECHPAEFESQSRSGHAHALAASANGQPGEWAFGAGVQAITFLARVDRESYRELGETWYRALNGYAITPGHKNRDGVVFRTFDPAARTLRCFGCHSTGPVTLAGEESIVPHENGVRCEVCHGAGSAHAAAPATIRLRIVPGTEQLSFCGKCHRLDLDTGKELTDLANPWILRSPPRMLAASACYAKSRGCVTCHSPHEALEQSLAAYDAICTRCHASAVHRQPVAGQACAQCHMPPVRLDNLVFTNHRIGIYGAASPLVPVSARVAR
jgi:predicted CXXCH cytochrome family protein